MDSWLLKVVHRIALRRLLAWGLLTACGVVFCVYNLRYIKNFLGGPYALQESALLRIKNADTTSKYYLRVTGTRTVDTGLEEISIEKENGAEVSRSVSADYYALLVGQHWLIVKPIFPLGSLAIGFHLWGLGSFKSLRCRHVL